jgi:hypothetical protein
MRWVTLVIPGWSYRKINKLCTDESLTMRNSKTTFEAGWARNRHGGRCVSRHGPQMIFYPARYHADLGSIFAMGDIISLLPPDKMDVCVLEGGHLNWFRAPDGWISFQFVVGIVHTVSRILYCCMHACWKC